MKTNIKIISGCILFAFFAMSSFGQVTAKTTKETLKKHVKLEKSKVPKPVTESYYREYPVTTYDNWYSYPAYNYQNDWFDNWYDYLDNYTESPEFYVIESTKDNTPFKVIYDKTGAKIAVHKTLKSALPKAVLATISVSKYKTWNVAKNDQEEIFKDKDTPQLKIYKVSVEKGNEKHNLFFKADGKLLRDKKVS